MIIKGWLISEIKLWDLNNYKFMAIKEDHTQPFGYREIYGYTIEEIKSKIN